MSSKYPWPAVVMYVITLGGAAVFGVRLFLLGQGWTADGPESPWAWPIDLGWLLLFGVQHSGMARLSFEAVWRRFVPARWERSFYALMSGLVLLGLGLTWQPIDGPLLWSGPSWIVSIAVMGAVGMTLVNLRFDHRGLFGLRQASEPIAEPETLLIQGPYRFVRHPLIGCLLVVLWGHPLMSPTLTLLSAGLTVYIGIGLILEERDLLRHFGPAYAAYQRRVPALIPWRRPVPAAVHASVTPPSIGGRR